MIQRLHFASTSSDFLRVCIGEAIVLFNGCFAGRNSKALHEDLIFVYLHKVMDEKLRIRSWFLVHP